MRTPTGIATMFLLLAAALAPCAIARADRQPASLFDPARHMRVAEVKPGMKGYGLTVFKGTKIERFDVEVLSVLKNFNPKYDVVLIQCHGEYVEHTGAVAGMSGSPIYLIDDAGRARMIGAFAYGWPLTKDPVAGVQPVEYMLSIPTDGPSTNPTVKVGGDIDSGETTHGARGRARWSLDDVIPLPGAPRVPRRYPFKSWNDRAPNPRLSTGFDTDTNLRPLVTPLMTSGLSPKVIEQLTPIFRAYGIEPLQAGGGGGGDPATMPADLKLEPGSVLGVPILSGDAEATAVGTCTEVIGNRVYGFGHPFNNEGPVALPMGTGQIHTVIANLATSFKLGSFGEVKGTLLADQTVGVAGRTGEAPPTAAIDVRVVYADGSLDRSYSFQSALHPRLTPLIGAAALAAALGGVKDLPQYHTLQFDLDVEFANGRSLKIANTGVNTGVANLFFEVGTPIVAAADNPFERVMLRKLSGTITVTPEAREAAVLSVNVPRLKFRPGETMNAYVVFRPFRAAESILPVTFELPRDLPDGQYQLVVSDWDRYVQDERASRPFRFSAENIDDVFAVLKDFTSLRHDAMYLRLIRQPDGVAVGRTAMPHLPSSRRQVIMGSGRSDTTAFVSSTVKVIPTEHVMSGSADFQITIDKDAKVDVARPAAKRDAAAKPADSQKSGVAAPSEK